MVTTLGSQASVLVTMQTLLRLSLGAGAIWVIVTVEQGGQTGRFFSPEGGKVTVTGTDCVNVIGTVLVLTTVSVLLRPGRVTV